MKILELTNYSAGICGVWQRVKQEAGLLSKNHEVRVFTSNLTKGSDEIAPPQDQINKVKIQRFSAKPIGGESFMKWNFKKSALEFNPDIIIAHSYRHPHTTQALKIAKKTNSKVFLVTHAPFIQGNITRSFLQKLLVKFYDTFIAPRNINKFNKLLAITKWEVPFLLNIGAKQEKLVHIPNGIPKEFFTQQKSKPQNKILFLGRIFPVKDLEVLISAMSLLKDKNIILEIVGPSEQNYLQTLKQLVKKKGLENRITFSKPIYDLKEKITKIDSAKIFILPSKTEAMPQSLIEALAREKIVIASNNRGAKDLINEEENGYLFQIGNSKALAEKINLALSTNQDSIKKQAKKSVEKFSWDKVIRKLEKLF